MNIPTNGKNLTGIIADPAFRNPKLPQPGMSPSEIYSSVADIMKRIYSANYRTHFAVASAEPLEGESHISWHNIAKRIAYRHTTAFIDKELGRIPCTQYAEWKQYRSNAVKLLDDGAESWSTECLESLGYTK